MEKCYFLKILQWPDFEILGGHSHHQDTPRPRHHLHLLLGYQGGQEEDHASKEQEEPINCQEKCQAETGVPHEEVSI